MKMDELNLLVWSTTVNGVNGGPDTSFLRAEREVVSLLISLTHIFFFASHSPLVVLQTRIRQLTGSPSSSGDPQSLFRRHRELHGQAAAGGRGGHGAEPEEEEEEEKQKAKC